MQITPDRLFQPLVARIRSLDATRHRVDALVQSGSLSNRAAEQVYESLFLNAFAAFEAFVEDIFLRLLVSPTRKTRRSSAAVPRVSVKSLPIARDLVVGPGRKYVDWLPYERTIERANLFFRGGRPFTEIPAPEQEVVNRAQVIRNAIAHRSRHSEERFRKQVIAGTALAPRECKPAGYLRGLLSASPAVTRYENYIAVLLGVARKLVK